MSIASTIWKKAVDAHEDAVARGEHDERCEWRPGFYLCHCSKRRRERQGLTATPGELIWLPPLCPRCEQTVEFDADGFHCHTCSVFWPRTYPGHHGEFTDDYGDLAAELAKWETKRGGETP